MTIPTLHDPSDVSPEARHAMERNLRWLPLWWVLRWVWLGEAIWVVYLIDVRGLTLGQVLAFEAAYSVAVVLAQVPTGVLADRFGQKRVLVSGSLMWALAFVVFGLGEDIGVLLGSYMLFALGFALLTGADDAFLFTTLRGARRSEEFARQAGRLNAAAIGSSAVVTLLGSLMVRWTPLSWPIVLSALASLLAAGIGLLLREPPRSGQRRSLLETGLRATRRVLRSPPLRWSIALVAGAQVAATVVYVVLQPLVVSYGMPVWALGGFTAAVMLGSAIGGLSSAPLGRRLGLDGTLRALALLGGAGVAAGAAGHVWLFPIFILPAFAWNAMHPLVADFLARRVPDGERATVLSINQLAAQLGAAGVTLALGVAIDRAGTGRSLAAAGGVMLLVGLIAYWRWRSAGDLVLGPAVPSTEGAAFEAGDWPPSAAGHSIEAR